MSNPMAVTLSSYDASRTEFDLRYYLLNCDSTYNGHEIQIAWSDLEGAINSFLASYTAATPGNIALRFVYCFDPLAAVNSLYYRLQLLTMTQSVVPGTYNLNVGPNDPSAWYEIRNKSFQATPNSATRDQAYFNSFYYCNAAACSELTVVSLAANPALFARNIVFPWLLEVKQLQADNPTGVTLCFGACSFPATTPVSSPHSLVLFMRDVNGKMLMDDSQTDTFQMKGADMGTMCPVACDVYVMPTLTKPNPTT